MPLLFLITLLGMFKAQAADHMELADKLFHEKQYEEALEHWRVADAQGKDCAGPLGMTLYALARYDEAIPYLRKACEEGGELAALLGAALLNKGQYQEAIVYLEEGYKQGTKEAAVALLEVCWLVQDCMRVLPYLDDARAILEAPQNTWISNEKRVSLLLLINKISTQRKA